LIKYLEIILTGLVGFFSITGDIFFSTLGDKEDFSVDFSV